MSPTLALVSAAARRGRSPVDVVRRAEHVASLFEAERERARVERLFAVRAA